MKFWQKTQVDSETWTMNGTISQLHKGGGTNKTSDQRSIFLLNSVYTLLNYVINKRLKKIVEPANILGPGQGGGRQGRCDGIHMQKVHFIQQGARKQGKRVYRVDIDFLNRLQRHVSSSDMRTPSLEFQMLTYWSICMKAPWLGWPQTMRTVQQSPSTQV